MRTVWAAALGLLALAPPWAARGQSLERSCVADEVGTALDLAVDGRGRLHLSRLSRVLGNLHYTVVDAGGAVSDEIVARGVSRLAFDDVTDTRVLLQDGRPRLCYYDAAGPRLQVALRDGPPDAPWLRETVVAGARAGEACALGVTGGQLFVAYRHQGRLRIATRRQPGDWVVSNVDGGENANVGLHVDAAVGADGRVALAHRDGADRSLRVSVGRPGQAWQTAVVDTFGLPAGFEPKVSWTPAGQLRIAHGVVPGSPDNGPDEGLLFSEGPPSGPFRTVTLIERLAGGSVGAFANVNGSLFVFTRLRQRSALFPPEDALQFFAAVPGDLRLNTLEQHSAAQPRHRYLRLRARPDPFGLPVLAFFDDVESAGGRAQTCFWRPPDRDVDAVPDEIEALLGTDPAVPDTDGDGRTDGEEVLVDGTDPLRPPGVEPDAGLPEPDAEVPPPVDADVPPPVDADLPPPVDADSRPPVDADSRPPPLDAAVTPPPVDAAVQPLRDAAAPPPRRDAAEPVEADVGAGPTPDAAMADPDATEPPPALDGGEPPRPVDASDEPDAVDAAALPDAAPPATPSDAARPRAEAGGHDAGDPPPDGAADGDAGPADDEGGRGGDDGCGCSFAPGGSAPFAWLMAGLLLALRPRRRRPRRLSRRPSPPGAAPPARRW